MRRSKIEAYVHFVWATVQRQELLVGENETSVYRCIQSLAQESGCDVIALNGMLDHVHLLVRLPATVSISGLMKSIKGASSKFAEEQLGGESFQWQEGCAAFTISRSHIDRVATYVRNQKRHHAEGKLWPEWEETDEPAR